ncbi:MAG: hypothetical protein OEZ58_13540 [Gammaproteobacteria bacterium]|nr:hypothetical protein [Gammaproteobacteria bacterium]
MNWPKLENIHTIVFDFDGVFTNNKVYLNQYGEEWVQCDRGDGLGFDLIKHIRKEKNFDFQLMVLSKEKNSVVAARAKKLGICCQYGVSNKKKYLDEYFLEKGFDDPFSGLIYLGNDLNDLPVMRVAGFSVAPDDAHILVKECASVTLGVKGGDGFIRGFVEKLLNLRDMTPEELDELICNC